MKRFITALVGGALLMAVAQLPAAEKNSDADKKPPQAYRLQVLQDKPIAYWRFDDPQGKPAANCVEHGQQKIDLTARATGRVHLGQEGPRTKHYPLFEKQNGAAGFFGEKGFLRVTDPGEKSVLDFQKGDAITLEAWINPDAVGDGRQLYIIGKGRTNNKGFARDNQNYALRLRGMGGTARLSFLFRTGGKSGAFHRWNSDTGIVPDGHWHHVAVTFTFGEKKDPRGYLDGVEVAGSWDMGGQTESAPVVDDDELWIGSTSGGNLGNTFVGLIDEVAIYRRALPAETFATRYRANLPDLRQVELDDANLPSDKVLVEIHEGIPARDSWPHTLPSPTASYTQSAFAFVGLPKKYSSKGLIIDRTNPHLVRARTKRKFAAGDYEVLLRSKSAARLFIDGKLVVQTGFMSRNASGHETVPELPAPQRAYLRSLSAGHQERLASIALDEKEHVFRLEVLVGGKGLRSEAGEPCVAIGRKGQPFDLLTAASVSAIPLDDEHWDAFAAQSFQQLQQINAESRRRNSVETDKYWQRRHEIARRELEKLPALKIPDAVKGMPIFNEVDRFIGAQLAKEKATPAPLTDDYEFLRRATIDLLGRIPAREEIAALAGDKSPRRRHHVIDRLLDDSRWADNWVGYWQDVLAENPGILKPKLNNTGPFRYWIHESFIDNKPMDRFVTELVMMEGSTYGGGPAGFAMATQNDVPMAAKAHVLGKAFLGLEMTCARCHDAPFHEYTQENLFSLAAMLDKKAIKLPKTSTVPLTPGGRKPLITISLKPGATIKPHWPFSDLAPQEFAEGVIRKAGDTRENLAATITTPHNRRFAQVMVNRLWQRYLGQGLVESVDDWEGAEPSHPVLLDYLAREFVSHGYDVKHVARLILNSHAYQRQVRARTPQGTTTPQRLFASPARRRMSAEQLVDSLFFAADKPFRVEALTLDPEGRRPASTFLNLGSPTRAWEFTSLSNERDRPALALPSAQSTIDVLSAFGWRDARPNSLTLRDETPTVLQPLSLANGTMSARITRLSDDNALTQLCLEDRPLKTLIEQVSLHILSRPPTEEESAIFVELLNDGYDQRRIAIDSKLLRKKPRKRNFVSWSNHLNPEATRIKLEMERAVRAGDPPTDRLQADWRGRMEDAIWAMINSPEFLFLP